MTDQHPITPPPELVKQWDREAVTAPMAEQSYIATQAARWGADQELEACINWMRTMGYWGEDGVAIPRLRAARRQPSLKEQALNLIDSNSPYLDDAAIDIIRRALVEQQ